MKDKICSDELMDWKLNQIRLRQKYSSTPPGFPDTSSRDRILSEWFQKKAQLEARRQYRLESVPPVFSEAYTGGEAMCNEISSLLDAHKSPVFLYGTAGTGKSALARNYAASRSGSYSHILFLPFKSNVQRTVCDDQNLAISNLSYSREHYGNRRKYFLEKCSILSEIAANEKLLIILDDCSATNDRDMELLFSIPADYIVTTRINPALWSSYSGIHIQGNTGALKENCCRPGQAAEKWSVFARDLFFHFPLKKEEKQALCYLSVMPAQGISRSLFLRISGISDETVRRLLCFLYIKTAPGSSRTDEILIMPPLIARAAREIFVPSPGNCSKLLTGFKEYIQDAWDWTYIEKERVKPYVLAFIRAFPSPVPWMSAVFWKLAALLSSLGMHSEAEEYSLKLFSAVESYYTANHQYTGRTALWTGLIYLNSIKFDQAHSWFSRALDILKNCPPADHTHLYLLGQTYLHAARILGHKKQLPAALEMTGLSIQYLKDFQIQYGEYPAELDTDSRLLYACALLVRAEVLFFLGNANEAEETLNRAFSVCETISYHGSCSVEFSLFRTELLIDRTEFAKAEEVARRNLETAVTYGGDSCISVLACRLQLSRIRAALKKNC